RLLYQRQDKAAVPDLRALAAGSKSPVGRMHALHALDGLRALTPVDVAAALADPDPRVRRHALRLAERGGPTAALPLSVAVLAAQTAAANRADEVAAVVKAVDALPDADRPLARDLVRAFVGKLPPAARAGFAGLATGKAGAVLTGLLADAAKAAADEAADPAA